MTDSHKVAVELLEAFKAQDASRFRKLFFSPLALLITNYRVGKLFDLTNWLLGPLESWTDLEVHQSGRFTVYKTFAKFQRGRQALTLKIWGNKAVGANVANAAEIGLLPAWEAPSYVDESAFTEQEVFVRPYWLLPGTKGTLNIPSGSAEKRMPAVLFISGSGPTDMDATMGGAKCFKDLAYGLASAGFVTLRMEKPGAVVAWKQMVTKTCTIEDEYITPLSAALKYLAAHPAVDPARIFLLGHSLGGLVAPRLCQASPVPITGLVSCAGASIPLCQTMISQLTYLNEHFPRPTQEYFEKEIEQNEAILRCLERGGPKRGEPDPTKDLPVPVPLPYLKDMYDHDSVAVAAKLDVPMLFIQGKRDWQVGMQEFVKWQTGLEGSKAIDKAEWKIYDDIGHTLTVVDEKKHGTFQYDEPAHVKDELVKDVIDFMKRVGDS